MGIVLYRMYHMVSCFLAGLCCEPCLLTLTISDVQWSEAISLTLPISYLAMGIAQPRVATPPHSQDPNHIATGRITSLLFARVQPCSTTVTVCSTMFNHLLNHMASHEWLCSLRFGNRCLACTQGIYGIYT